MKMRLALALFGICIKSGCHGEGRLYPVQGPLASTSPAPSYSFSVTYPGSPNYGRDQSGELSLVMANGESFSGPWKLAASKPGGQAAGAARPMATAWPPHGTRSTDKAFTSRTFWVKTVLLHCSHR